GVPAQANPNTSADARGNLKGSRRRDRIPPVLAGRPTSYAQPPFSPCSGLFWHVHAPHPPGTTRCPRPGTVTRSGGSRAGPRRAAEGEAEAERNPPGGPDPLAAGSRPAADRQAPLAARDAQDPLLCRHHI